MLTPTIDDVYTSCFTKPYAVLLDSNGKELKENLFDDIVPEDGKLDLVLNFTTKGFKAGTYSVVVKALPVYQDGTVVDSIPEDQYVSFTYYVKLAKLKAPTSVKAAAGKGKVTMSYKKATGATAYGIYRSTKKNGNYKVIGTTTKAKYVDKKVKKGKKYFYIVAAARKVQYDESVKSVAIVSSDSKTAASGKVK